MSRVLVTSVLLIVVTCSADEFAFCKLSQPDADKCLAKNIESAIRSLKTGAPEYGLSSMDPLHVDSITIAASQTIQLVQYYTNVDLIGFSNINIKKAHYDPDKKLLSFVSTFPQIIQQGNCVADGKLLSLVVQGDGNSSLSLENTEIVANVQFEEAAREGQTYLKIKSLLLNVTPKKMVAYFANLFNGNKLLSDNIGKLINEEWETLFKDVKPSINENYGLIFKDYAQPFFEKVPADMIFSK